MDDLLLTAFKIVMAPLAFAIACLVLPIIVAFFIIFRSVVFISGYLFRENVAGKVVLITGASSGIGEHMAYEYAKMGARLALVARRKEKLEGVAATARGFGSPDVLVLRADVSDVNDCRRSIDETIHHFDRLDHLVNNAGIGHIFALEEITDITTSRSLMEVNYWGSVYPTYFAIPHLRKSKGKIVVNSSTSAIIQPPSMSFYASSKAASIAFFESLRGELDHDVSISIVTLGFVESELTQGKLLSENGQVIVEPNRIKSISPKGVPMWSADKAAKAIVEAVSRGERYITLPKLYSSLMFFKYFWPELIEWHFRRSKFGKLTRIPTADRVSSKAD